VLIAVKLEREFATIIHIISLELHCIQDLFIITNY